ncbi:hypothetical protein [Sphingomonas sp. GB1N7]|uniref:hypothetical protein n=1 Tax=Parasphingomonas caseinilytica TaxID=3096158 RepID=UPI002FC9B878
MDAEKLYLRALEIREGKGRGTWVAKLRHLSLRGHTDAMIELASWYTCDNQPDDLLGMGEPYTAANLYYRAWRKGDARAAQHLALSYFNRGDMLRFRLWLRRAAKLGEHDCQILVRCFETRLYHQTAKRVGRLRPIMKRDGFV